MQNEERSGPRRRTLTRPVTFPSVRPARAYPPAWRAALQLAAAFALLKLLLQFALTIYTSHIGYGYFRDEFYFLICGRHLAWGYVDQGPTVAVMARVGERLFGDSVFAFRIFPAVAGAFAIGLTGLITWALGGQRAAQALAMFTLLLCPVYLATAGTLCIPSLEPMFWLATVLCVLLLQHGGSPRVLWLSIGVLAGVGLLTKPSMLFFLVALLTALLLSPQRGLLRSPWLGAAAVLALLIVAPFLLWEVHNGWPTWEFLRNGQIHHKVLILGPLAFVGAQVSQLSPFTALVWVPGLVGCFALPSLKPFRWIGLTYLLFLALMFALHAKDYYLAPIYPVLFAAGAVFWQARLLRRRPAARERLIGFPVLESVLMVTGLLILPMASPVLRPYTWSRYTHALHLVPNEQESSHASILPQFYADRFGWTQLTDLVVNSFHALSPADQQHVCIFASNYGEAGALDFLGRRAEPKLPPVLSGHNNYWLWGQHGCSGDLVIAVIHDTPEELHSKYHSVTVLGALDDPLAMSYEHTRVYLLRHRRPDSPVNWNDEKFYQ